MTRIPTDRERAPDRAQSRARGQTGVRAILRRWWAGWPRWVGPAAATWSLAYAAFGLFWWGGGGGFPFGTAADPGGAGVSLLEHALPGTAGPVLAAAGLCGAALAMALRRSRRPARVAHGVLTGAGWVMAVTLAVVIPDYRPLLAVVRAPMLLIGAPFGWPEQVRLAEFFGLFLPWPVLNQLVFIAGGLLWAATVLAYQRRVRSACGNCGRADADAGSPAGAARWGRWAVAVAVAVPFGYALTRWAWALDIPLGVSRAGLHREAADSPGIWLAGALLATMAAGGALLTVGLVRPWGETYPRWIPYLRGKRVAPRTAIIPATAVALLITSAGLMFLPWFAMGRIELTANTWGLFVPEFFWPVWGIALGVATLAYHLRRRGRCAHCGRGGPAVSATSFRAPPGPT
jgi:hypothetical protein